MFKRYCGFLVFVRCFECWFKFLFCLMYDFGFFMYVFVYVKRSFLFFVLRPLLWVLVFGLCVVLVFLFNYFLMHMFMA